MPITIDHPTQHAPPVDGAYQLPYHASEHTEDGAITTTTVDPVSSAVEATVDYADSSETLTVMPELSGAAAGLHVVGRKFVEDGLWSLHNKAVKRFL